MEQLDVVKSWKLMEKRQLFRWFFFEIQGYLFGLLILFFHTCRSFMPMWTFLGLDDIFYLLPSWSWLSCLCNFDWPVLGTIFYYLLQFFFFYLIFVSSFTKQSFFLKKLIMNMKISWNMSCDWGAYVRRNWKLIWVESYNLKYLVC